MGKAQVYSHKYVPFPIDLHSFRPMSKAPPRLQGSWGHYGAHRGRTGPRRALCWPHELCYLGSYSFDTDFSTFDLKISTVNVISP